MLEDLIMHVSFWNIVPDTVRVVKRTMRMYSSSEVVALFVENEHLQYLYTRTATRVLCQVLCLIVPFNHAPINSYNYQ